MAYRWYTLPNGRSVYRKEPVMAPQARSDLPCPQIVRPFSSPVQSMANGKWYDTPAELRRTYRADGNPQGVEYIELGNEKVPGRTVAEPTDAELSDILDKAEAQVERGEVPELVSGL